MKIDQYLEDKPDFVKCILLCHDCTKLVTTGKKSEIVGANLDEQALLRGFESANSGEFLERSGNTITIKMANGYELVYDLIYTNNFTSERKLMSVVVRD